MSGGRFIAVVGPSGVGKDSLIDGLVARCTDLHRVRRVITRPADAGGEEFDAADVDAFHEMRARGAFCLSWGAHGLFYGIPERVRAQVAHGRDVIANLSRGVLAEAADQFTNLLVLNVTARPDILAARLAGRGRESAADIAQRLSRSVPLPPGLTVVEIPNNGALDAAVDTALRALYPVKA